MVTAIAESDNCMTVACERCSWCVRVPAGHPLGPVTVLLIHRATMHGGWAARVRELGPEVSN